MSTQFAPEEYLQRASKLPAGGKCCVVVVGAGIVGLTTALRLHEAGHNVAIVAAETPNTVLARESTKLKGRERGTYTSSGSGGYWMPFTVAGNVEHWATTTFHMQVEEAANATPGVSMHDGFILRATDLTDMPWWKHLTNMKTVTHAEDHRVPSEYKGAWLLTVPIVHMDVYMLHLEYRARAKGIDIDLALDVGGESAIKGLTLAQVCDYAESKYGDAKRLVIVNCCGTGASKLWHDDATNVGRGVTVRVKRPPHINYFITEDKADGLLSRNGLLVYCLPRGDEYTLGGTLFVGDWNESTGLDEVAALKERCEHLIPGISTWEQTGFWTGLRPLRKSGVRVEVCGIHTTPSGRCITVVSNYGHGGSGVTICWGTADTVSDILATHFAQ